MTDVLDGIEFRTLNPALPSWNKDIYTDWLPAGNLTEFPSGTQFRVKPVFNYVVESCADENVQSVVELRTPSKDNAMKKVAQLVEEGKAVKIEKYQIPTKNLNGLLTDRKVQYKFAGQDRWTHPNYLTAGSMGITSSVKFRIRPDLYWEVTVKGAVSENKLTFDEFDTMHKFVDNKIRTTDFDISIRKLRYAG